MFSRNLRVAGAVLVATFFALPPGSIARAEGAPVAALRGAALLKTDVLGVFAHPDDETGVAAAIAALALGQNRSVVHVYCTRGEGGGNMVGTHYGRALGLLREAELRDCLAHLGVRACHFLDREDFAYTESLAATFDRWDHEQTLGRLVLLVRALRPEVIVTMNPAPTPGQHGNHQAAGWLAVEAFDAAADPQRFPEQIEHEGLAPWRPRKLYIGGAGAFTAVIVTTNALPDGRIPAFIAGEALAHHRSQGFGNFGRSPWLARPQQFQLAKSTVPFVAQETDLFRGLPVAGDTPERVFPNLPADPAPAVAGAVATRVHIGQRPAVARFQSWLVEQQLPHLNTGLTPDVPVVAGEDSPVKVEVVGDPGATALPLRVVVPDGWTATPAEVESGGGRAGTNTVTVLVRPPADGRDDVDFTLHAGTADGPVVAAARLHPVPRLRIPRVTAAPAVDTEDAAPLWAGLPQHLIPYTSTWQGRITNAADCEARFRVGHDGTNVYVEVRVTDDHVVSNIAPDDIRGHWRSDSVELCLNPRASAEHTFGTYKLGIFPFDTQGHVRAARDADARPGLREDSAPDTRLVSWKTADGYAIRAAIPFQELNLTPAKARRIGFNVLIYDGDKADAAPGENINKSRLAWAPRSGVQGRPEDWGRADLE